jgi:hypothetical protein
MKEGVLGPPTFRANGESVANASYRFVVRKGEQDRLCLFLEPASADLPVLENGTIGLDLREGTSLDDAAEIAGLLNRADVSVTNIEI